MEGDPLQCFPPLPRGSRGSSPPRIAAPATGSSSSGNNPCSFFFRKSLDSASAVRLRSAVCAFLSSLQRHSWFASESRCLIDLSPGCGALAAHFLQCADDDRFGGRDSSPAAVRDVICMADSAEQQGVVEENASVYRRRESSLRCLLLPSEMSFPSPCLSWFRIDDRDGWSEFSRRFTNSAVLMDLGLLLARSPHLQDHKSPASADERRSFCSSSLDRIRREGCKATILVVDCTEELPSSSSSPAAAAAVVVRDLVRVDGTACQAAIYPPFPHPCSQSGSDQGDQDQDLVRGPRLLPGSVADIPSVQSRAQLRYLRRFPPLRQRLQQVVFDTQLYAVDAAIQHRVWEYFIDRIEARSNDQLIYESMFRYIHPPSPEAIPIRNLKTDQGAADHRSSRRVSQIMEVLRMGFQFSITTTTTSSSSSSTTTTSRLQKDGSVHFLDVGCSEGSITGALAAAIRRELRHSSGSVVGECIAHGCDVIPVATDGSAMFSFSLIDGCPASCLPYETGQFQIVTALMSMHHMVHLDHMLREIYRVLADDGVLVIREHDCQPAELSVVLDAMHAFYAMVWWKPQEDNKFCSSYYAHYRTRSAWRRILSEAGFALIEQRPNDVAFLPPAPPTLTDAPRSMHHHSQGAASSHGRIRNPFRYYYDIFSKKRAMPQ